MCGAFLEVSAGDDGRQSSCPVCHRRFEVRLTQDASSGQKGIALQYLQDGRNDLDNPFGNWPLANQMMSASLKYMKYDHRFDFTESEHNSDAAGPLLPEALKWLWQGYAK